MDFPRPQYDNEDPESDDDFAFFYSIESPEVSLTPALKPAG